MSSFWSTRKPANYQNIQGSDEKSAKSHQNTQDKDLELQKMGVYSAGCTQLSVESETHLPIPPQSVLRSTTIKVF